MTKYPTSRVASGPRSARASPIRLHELHRRLVRRAGQVVLVGPGFEGLEAVEDQVVGRELMVQPGVEGVGERGERPRRRAGSSPASASSFARFFAPAEPEARQQRRDQRAEDLEQDPVRSGYRPKITIDDPDDHDRRLQPVHAGNESDGSFGAWLDESP